MTKPKHRAYPPGWITITEACLIMKEGYQRVRDRFLRDECGPIRREGRVLLAHRDAVMKCKRAVDSTRKAGASSTR